MKKNIMIYFLIVCFFGSCLDSSKSYQSSNSDSLIIPDTATVKMDSITQNIDEEYYYIIKGHNNSLDKTTSISIDFYKNRIKEDRKIKVDLRKYNQALTWSQYNTGYSNCPVQLDSKISKIYISITKGNEITDYYEWTKLLEYNIASDTIKEIITLNGAVDTWIYSELNDKIYWFASDRDSLLSLDLMNGEVKNLYGLEGRFDRMEFQWQHTDSIDFILGFRKEIGKLSLNILNDSIKYTTLLNERRFSSFNNELLVTPFKSNKDGGFVIHNGGNRDSIAVHYFNSNTYWLNNDEIIITMRDSLLKLNLLNKKKTIIKKRKIHVSEVLSNHIIVSYRVGNNKRIGLLDNEFSVIEEIDSINVHRILSIKNYKP